MELLTVEMGIAAATMGTARLSGAPAECVVVTPCAGGLPRIDLWVRRLDGSVGCAWGYGPDTSKGGPAEWGLPIGALVCRAIEGRYAPDGTCAEPTGHVAPVVNLFPAVS